MFVLIIVIVWINVLTITNRQTQEGISTKIIKSCKNIDIRNPDYRDPDSSLHTITRMQCSVCHHLSDAAITTVPIP